MHVYFMANNICAQMFETVPNKKRSFKSTTYISVFSVVIFRNEISLCDVDQHNPHENLLLP